MLSWMRNSASREHLNVRSSVRRHTPTAWDRLYAMREEGKDDPVELAEKIGTNKSYISRIEKGIVDPGISTFCRIIDALGLKIEIVKPVL